MAASGADGQGGTAAAVCEFLETAVHVILYQRGVYPPAVFERRLKYGLPVRACRHPGVRAYVADVVRGLLPALAEGEASRVVVAVVPAETPERPLERFVFELALLGGLGDELPALEEELRACLARLNAANSRLREPDPAVERSFRVLLHVDQGGPTAAGRADPDGRIRAEWVPCGAGETLAMERPLLVPLRSVDSRHLLMQLFVEEGA